MFPYCGLLENPLIHLETERNNRIDQNELQSINWQFENTWRGIIAPLNFSAGGTYITFLSPAEEISLSDKWGFTV
jgi:hypothetical protein